MDANDTHEWPAWPELVTLCRRIWMAGHELVLPDHHVTLLNVRPYLMPRGWNVNTHEHSFYEVNVILAGTARYAEQTLVPGDVMFHGPRKPHTWSAPDADCLRIIFWFEVDPPIPVPLFDAWPHWPHLLPVVADLLQSVAEMSPGWRNVAAMQLGVILARVLTLGDLPPSAIEDAQHELSFVNQVDWFLRDNLAHAISLDDVAICLGISVSSLSHRYRELAGTTVMQRLTMLRMEQAANALVQTNQDLTTICDEIGIADPPYFCRLFKRYFNRTPMHYRQMFRQ